MLHRNKKEKDLNKDKWIGVGGKFEEIESPYDCVIREVREETGLDIIDPIYRAVITFISDEYESELMHLFTVKTFSGELITCDEGDLEWVDKKDIYSLNLWEGDKIFLDLLVKDEPFFSLKLVYEKDKLVEYKLNK